MVGDWEIFLWSDDKTVWEKIGGYTRFEDVEEVFKNGEEMGYRMRVDRDDEMVMESSISFHGYRREEIGWWRLLREIFR